MEAYSNRIVFAPCTLKPWPETLLICGTSCEITVRIYADRRSLLISLVPKALKHVDDCIRESY